MDKKKVFKHIKSNLTNYLVVLAIIVIALGMFSGERFPDVPYGVESYSKSSYGTSLSRAAMQSDGISESINLGGFESLDLSFSIKTRSVKDTYETVSSFANTKNFTIISRNLYEHEKHPSSAHISVRTSREEFTVLEAYLEQNFHTETKSLNIYNLEEQVTRTSTQLERYKTQVEKYRRLLNQDGLEIEEEIKLNQRIDQLENQIFYIEQDIDRQQTQINFVDASISISEKRKPFKTLEFKSVKELAASFVEAVVYTYELIVVILGYIIIPAIVYGVWRILKRKRRN